MIYLSKLFIQNPMFFGLNIYLFKRYDHVVSSWTLEFFDSFELSTFQVKRELVVWLHRPSERFGESCYYLFKCLFVDDKILYQLCVECSVNSVGVREQVGRVTHRCIVCHARHILRQVHWQHRRFSLW